MTGTAMDNTFADHPIGRAADFLSAAVDDHLVLLDIAKSVYYDLDPVAADIWRLLAVPRTTAALRDHLVAAYDGDADQIEADTLAFLRDMLARGMISTEAP